MSKASKLRRAKRRAKRLRARLFVGVGRRRSTGIPQVGNTLVGTTYYYNSTTKQWVASSSSYYNPTARGYYSSQKAIWDATHPGPPYRIGGPLSVFEWSDPWAVSSSGIYYSSNTGAANYKYVGGFWPSFKLTDVNSLWTASNLQGAIASETHQFNATGDISTYGATGWNKARPGNPTADLGVFLGELRDVPRMLKGTASFFHSLWRSMGGSPSGFGPKKVADAWLNTQFGWKPFISDLRKFYQTYVNLDQKINQIKADNGKWIRRRCTVRNVNESSIIRSHATATAHRPILITQFYESAQDTGSYTLSVVSTQKVWFSGAFRYWIPDINSVQWRRRAIAELYGVMPCPSLVWNLIPWSWLVDWSSNLGDIISNMSTGYADNLAAKYAFIMGTTEVMGVLESTHKLRSGHLHNVWTYPLKWKKRTAASPFGFGLSEDNFTLRQWSILSALGITRVH